MVCCSLNQIVLGGLGVSLRSVPKASGSHALSTLGYLEGKEAQHPRNSRKRLSEREREKNTQRRIITFTGTLIKWHLLNVLHLLKREKREAWREGWWCNAKQLGRELLKSGIFYRFILNNSYITLAASPPL